MLQDLEIKAMSEVLNAFQMLDSWQRKRVIEWAVARFSLDEPEKFAPKVIEAQAPVPAIVEVAPVIEEAPEPEEVVEEEPMAVEAPKTRVPRGRRKAKIDEPKEKNIRDYDKVVDLFADAVGAKKVSAKILLMAAYLQERLNQSEVTSYEVNSKLKRIGHRIPNITSSINGILKKNPALMIVVDKGGDKKQARRKFRVTEEGIKLSNSFLD
ncbi:MAG: hypothetical protein GY765_14560 [bacterium]|nr:hypothetical protein [bacterium]